MRAPEIAARLAPTYYVVALTDVDQSNLSDPAFLNRVANSAATIIRTESDKKVQDLGIGR